MTFNDFLPLIHNGVKSAFYLVSTDENYCIICKDRDDLIFKLKENDFLKNRYNVVGVQPYSEDAIIIEFKVWDV